MILLRAKSIFLDCRGARWTLQALLASSAKLANAVKLAEAHVVEARAASAPLDTYDLLRAGLAVRAAVSLYAVCPFSDTVELM